MLQTKTIKLTHFSHGAGCGCKISPAILEKILQTQVPVFDDPNLVVGNNTKDDAAVYALNKEEMIISTTDFFMPIVDDPSDFGAIAAANALSDVYAMGGRPLMAIAILGWPIDKLPVEVAGQVLDGARKICAEAGIVLAGGHSIDCPEPVFGLAATGLVGSKNLKRNNSARKDDLLYLTKPLGIGIITTAEKRGLAQPVHLDAARQYMLKLNDLGTKLGSLSYVHAMTDVTGFGLLGHLLEMCEGSGLAARLDFTKVPKFDFLEAYINQNCLPGGTARNWESYGHKIAVADEFQKAILTDPQTSGGLLVAVDAGHSDEIGKILLEHECPAEPIGNLTSPREPTIIVR